MYLCWSTQNMPPVILPGTSHRPGLPAALQAYSCTPKFCVCIISDIYQYLHFNRWRVAWYNDSSGEWVYIERHILLEDCATGLDSDNLDIKMLFLKYVTDERQVWMVELIVWRCATGKSNSGGYNLLQTYTVEFTEPLSCFSFSFVISRVSNPKRIIKLNTALFGRNIPP